MKRLLTLFLVLFLVACAPSVETIQTAIAQTQVGWTPVHTQTAYPTYTSPPTVYVTKIVTPTFTATPIYTPTITNTPEPPTATPNIAATATAEAFAKLTADKDDGFYLIGIDIAPGVWRSTGTGTSCYWAVTSKTGDILDNHFGQAGGTAYIPTNGFQVQFEDCGTWVYLGPP